MKPWVFLYTKTMNRDTAKRKIETTLQDHSVITIPGIQKTRAKCYCGWTCQGMPGYVKDHMNQHVAHEIIDQLFGVQAELVEE